MGYESRLRFGFAGAAKVMTRFIEEARVADPEFEVALTDLVLIDPTAARPFHVLVNEFDWCKGFGAGHAYKRLFDFGAERSDIYLAEGGDDLAGAYLRVGEQPEDVEASWFGSDAYAHYSVGAIDTTFHTVGGYDLLQDGVRVSAHMPKLGCYDEAEKPPAFDGQRHLQSSLDVLLARINKIAIVVTS